MPQNYFVILTDIGRAKLANALSLGRQISLTHMVVGDGNGSAVTPDASRTSLVHEVYRAQLNALRQDISNPAYLVAELVIPPDTGGWTLREAGFLDADGDLFGVGNLPETYKPQLAEGSAAELRIRLTMEVGEQAPVQLKIDPTVVLASRKFVEKAVKDHAQDQSNPHHVSCAQIHAAPAADLTAHTGNQNNPHAVSCSQIGAATKANLDAHAGAKSNPHRVTCTQLGAATKAALDGHSGARNNPHHVTAAQVGAMTRAEVTNALGSAVPAGACVAFAGPVAPAGWLKCNGAAVSRTQYAALFAAIGTRFGGGNGASTFNLPDFRGEFVRGFDDGRGVDRNRALGAAQTESVGRHRHRLYGLSASHRVSSADQLQNGALGMLRSDADSRSRAYIDMSVYGTPLIEETGAGNHPRNIAGLYIIKY
ncbi:phage tail protein [Desulfobaculum bizertense]|uniref:phage tail protein n=1 Tax=Desulfobaculum bizertense TaxID=376490 RepID=UPI001F446CE5|nr:phage tail protein [Desulfobaculum bizertense]UIJ38731.1 phage tail protein [Desulfobaculum bizertense]